MLRRLIRDRHCPLVIRGVLESLLRFVTEDLPRWSVGNKSQEKSLKSQLARTGPQILNGSSSHPQKVKSRRSGENPKLINIKPRRLTSFQLLQSKFTRASPKPPVTHQREVGTLSFNKGVTQDEGRYQEIHRKDRAKTEPGLRRGSSVKDMVARFVVAEEKGRGQRTSERQAVKPRLLGKGSLLSCLKERFETMATVRHEGDLKDSHRRSEKETMGGVKDKVACYEKGQQQKREETPHQQLQDLKSKTLKRNQNGNQTKISPEEDEDVSAELKPEIREKIQPQAPDLLTQGSCDCRKVQSTADGTEPFNEPSIKHGSMALLCLTTVPQWSGPEPHRLSPQVLTPLECHVVTITTCSPTWSSCRDVTPRQHLHEKRSSPTEGESPKVAPPPNTHRDTRHNLFPPSSEDPKVQKPRADTDNVLMVDRAVEGQSRPQNGPKCLHQYVIPRVYRTDLPPSPEEKYNSHLSIRTRTLDTPQSEDTGMESRTQDKCLDPRRSSHTTTSTEPVETEQRENVVVHEEDGDTDSTKISSLDLDVVGSVMEMKPTEPAPEDKAQSLKVETKNQRSSDCDDVTDKNISNVVPRPNRSDTKSRVRESENQPRHNVNKSESEKCFISKHRPLKEEVCHDGHEEQSPLDQELRSEGTRTFEGPVPDTEPLHEASAPSPKYKTINYADPSVKQTFKPKIIRFTDTFTF